MNGGPSAPRAPSIAEIKRRVAAHYGLMVNDLTSARKERRATRARHVAIWLCRALTRHGATKIGMEFGGRDHSTVAAAWRGLERRMAADAGLKEEVDAMRVSILAALRAPAHADPTLRQLALAVFDQAQIAENEVSRWRSMASDLITALEARGQAERTTGRRQRARPLQPRGGLMGDRARRGGAAIWSGPAPRKWCQARSVDPSESNDNKGFACRWASNQPPRGKAVTGRWTVYATLPAISNVASPATLD